MGTDVLKHIDKYIVLENLGRGAKSTIWKVQDPGNGTIYTLKRVIRETEDDDRFFEQMQTEHQVSGRINHEYIRKSYELRKVRSWFKTQELLLILEYVEGKTLKQAPPIEMEDVIDLFIKVARGLDVLHQAGFIHADMKPKNILLTGNGNIKLIDFGQSCPIGHRKKRVQGTPDYIAPEQVKRGMLDQRTDIFNFGASLYWVLTNQAYPTSMSQDTGDIHLAPVKDVPRPDEVNNKVPMALSNLTMACCSREPAKRPENMAEVIARLDVARHLLLRQKSPEKYARTKEKKELSQKPVSADDTAEFERFLEDIL
ncbi:MAG: serine/threonine protein kinase [Phycisphaerae bacterium]|nr:serine/threonine protein kinase [Phycisphaerae bacterium]